MKELSAGKIIVRNSQFFTHLYYLNEKEEISNILKLHRLSYKKANHHCYAIRFVNNNDSVIELSKDDGEVGHPGKILLEILRNQNLEHHAIVISRIFGGVKLGVGGVSRAFRNAGEAVVKHHI